MEKQIIHIDLGENTPEENPPVKKNKKKKSKKRTVEQPEKKRRRPSREEAEEERRPRKSPLAIFNRILAVVILIVAGGFGILFFCPLEEVTVEGATVYTEDEIKALVLTEKYDSNTLGAWLMSYFRPDTGIAFVDKISIKPTARNAITITVTEKERYGVVPYNDTTYVYYDSEGTVTEVSDRFIDGTVIIQGITFDSEPEEEETLPVDESNVKTLLQLQEQLYYREISPQTIQFAEDGSLILYIGDIQVNLGVKTSLEQKILRLANILPQLEGQSGTLHLENWDEENTDIVFKKNQ